VAAIRQHKFAILLTTIVFALTAQSFGHTIIGGPIATDTVTLLAMMAVLHIVFDRRRERYWSMAAVGVAVAATLTHYFDLAGQLRRYVSLVQHGGYIVFTGFAALVILRNVFEQTRIGRDDVLGAICGYLLAGAAWANIYLVIYLLVPESFSLAPVLSEQMANWHSRNAVFNLVSLGSLTSVGYADVTAVKPPATVLTMLESVFGQFYIAVVVAQLVGLRMAHAPRRQ
jgi:voltage-gated potassium channel